MPTIHLRALPWVLRLWMPTVALSLLLACGGEPVGVPAPAAAPEDLFWSLDLDHHAVTMSTATPYNTFRVTATPRNYQGDPLADLPSPQYKSTATNLVSVTTDGMLIAASPTTSGPVAVVASLTADHVLHADTVWVWVTALATPPILGTFSIHPVPPDSAKSGAQQFNGTLGSFVRDINLLIKATDTLGTPFPTISLKGYNAQSNPVGSGTALVTDLLVSLRSSDTVTAEIRSRIQSGRFVFALLGKRPGVVQIYASTTAYGVSKTDTLTYRIGWPVFVQAPVSETVLSPNITMGTGGAVLWWTLTETGDTLDVAFADPSKVASFGASAAFFSASSYNQKCTFIVEGCPGGTGNFSLPVVGINMIGRTFPVPGVYDYTITSRRTGVQQSSRITVVDEQ